MPDARCRPNGTFVADVLRSEFDVTVDEAFIALYDNSIERYYVESLSESLPQLLRDVAARLGRDALAEQGVREQIAELPLDNQAMLVWELGCSIGYNLAEIRRQEQHASPAAPGDEDPLADWSDPFRERIYRMDALARRAVLAFINGDARTLGAVIERVRTWDDDPGRQPYELPRFQCVNKRALQVANDFFQVGDEHGAHLSNAEAAEGAMELIARHAPAEHQAAATVVLQTMRETADTVDFDSSTAHDAAGLLAFAAIAGWLGSNTRLFRSREAVRLMLTKQIRESEARALRIPQREQITEVTDDQALAFLDELYGKGYPIPRDPDERAVWELDIICLVKQHLLDTPADITTPDQKRALHEHITAILHAAAGTTPAPPAARRPSSAGGKKRPKRPKQQRRKKK